MEISVIAAMGVNREIGKDNDSERHEVLQGDNEGTSHYHGKEKLRKHSACFSSF